VEKSRVRAEVVQSNDYAFRHSDEPEVTNALTQHQLELLDISGDKTTRSNYLSAHHSPDELAEMSNTVRLFLTNRDAQTSYYFYKNGGLTEEQVRWKIYDLMLHTNMTKPWPEPEKKKAIFDHCAEVVRSSIDTNQISLVLNGLSGNAEASRVFQRIVNEAESEFDEISKLLASPDLKSFIGYGYRADITNGNNPIWTEVKSSTQ
jgi:hypothetical protein